MKLYTFYTPSHKVFYKNYFLPTAKKEFEVISHCHLKQYCNSASFSEDGWRETQYNKVLFWIDAVKENMGDVILCSDVDVQFLAPCKKDLTNTMKGHDLVFQQNHPNGGICSGFFMCRCSYKTENFLNIIAIRLKKVMHESGGGEQFVMSDLFKEGWHGLKVGRLDLNKYWSPRFKYEDVSELDVPENILVHHANWTVGIDNKSDQLDYVNTFISQVRSNFIPMLPSKNYKVDKNRIALCLSSLLRDFDVSSISLIFRILKCLPSKPDLIGYFPDICKTKKNLAILDSLSPYINKSFIKFSKDPTLPEDHLLMKENMAIQKSGIEGNLLQWRSMKHCAKLLKETQDSNEYNYDWVIWSRPDLYFFNTMDNLLNLSNKFFYLCAHDNHLKGLNDRFCVGNFHDVYNRMNIYDYFVNKWYPKYHNNKKYLIKNKSNNLYCWNPELILKHFLKKELKLKIKKINLCFGKIRNKFYVTAPFWHSLYATEATYSSSVDDIVNPYVSSIINKLPQYQQYQRSSWPLVNILDDTIMFNYPDRIKQKFHNIPIEVYNDSHYRGGFISKLLSKLHQKTMMNNESR